MTNSQKKKQLLNVAPKKKISRRKPGEPASKNYFDESTQDAIVRYIGAVNTMPDGTVVPDISKRNEIYIKEIFPAFSELIEKLINVYRYRVLFESNENLKNECMQALYEVIPKYNPNKGTKAFSYFNVVARHWLIIRSKQNVKRVRGYVSLDNRDALSKHDLSLIDSHNTLQSAEDLLTENNIANDLKQLLVILNGKVKTENEKLCMKAIEQIVDKIDEIDLLSKRAVMLYIREITGLSSKQLSIVLSSLKKQYKIAKEELNR